MRLLCLTRGTGSMRTGYPRVLSRICRNLHTSLRQETCKPRAQPFPVSPGERTPQISGFPALVRKMSLGLDHCENALMPVQRLIASPIRLSMLPDKRVLSPICSLAYIHLLADARLSDAGNSHPLPRLKLLPAGRHHHRYTCCYATRKSSTRKPAAF